MRHVALDVETTGLSAGAGDRVISIGCVELRERQFTGRELHRLLNPERSIPGESTRIHGITDQQVAGESVFSDLADEFLAFVRGAHLLGHNLEFDQGFLDAELERAGRSERLGDICELTCTLKMARARFPTQRNNLDAVSMRLGVASGSRGYHDALEDARLTASVWLRMTMGQGELSMSEAPGSRARQTLERKNLKLVRFHATAEDLRAHEKMLDLIDEKCEQGAAWRKERKES